MSPRLRKSVHGRSPLPCSQSFLNGEVFFLTWKGEWTWRSHLRKLGKAHRCVERERERVFANCIGESDCAAWEHMVPRNTSPRCSCASIGCVLGSLCCGAAKRRMRTGVGATGKRYTT